VTTQTNGDELTILIADDDDGHAELIVEQLREAGVCNPMIRFRDGQEAWEFLEIAVARREPEQNHPYLLLLDIRMPRMDGISLLGRIKSTPMLKTIPVVMLTTTDNQEEIETCYRLGCNCYLTKPIEFSRFAETLHRLGLFVMVIRVAKLQSNQAIADLLTSLHAK
jgi:CheY-like chemotaxis protein